MESRIPLAPGMNALHSSNLTKRSGKMVSVTTLNIKAEKNPNTILKNAARTMAKPRPNRMGILSLPRPHLEKRNHKGEQPKANSY